MGLPVLETMGQYASMDAEDADEVTPPQSPKPVRRRMTKAEKEQHQLEMTKSLATLQDLEDEKRHRQRNTWIGGAALLVTAVFSLASCSVTQNEITATNTIAEQQQARDRDQLRLRCVELAAESIGSLLNVAVTLGALDETEVAAGTGVPAAGADPSAMAGLTADYAKLAAVCDAAGLTREASKEQYAKALSGMFDATPGPLADQRAALVELADAFGNYIVADVTGVGSIFETPTGNDEPAE